MRYLGGKFKLRRELSAFLERHRRPGQVYIEPFVGAFNVIAEMQNPRIANDVNPYLIALYSAVQRGWIPPRTLTENEYADIKNNRDQYPPELVAFAGFGCSFGGKWFGGYARDKLNQNYALNAHNSLIKVAPLLANVTIVSQDYRDLLIPPNSLIYCDPPYKSTTTYTATNKFDHDVFWAWVRDKSLEGHDVFVSEFQAPDDFECVWSKSRKTNVTGLSGERPDRIEKLFTLARVENPLRVPAG